MIKILLFIICITFIPHLSADTFTKDRSKEVVIDNEKKLMWQNDENSEQLIGQWKTAVQYCENLVFAESDDWRLPKIEELESIVDDTSDGPAIDKNFLGFFRFFSSQWGRSLNYYWSSTSDVNDDRLAWFIDFNEGVEDIYYKDGLGFIRCVRDMK